jgi:hypothetical protein
MKAMDIHQEGDELIIKIDVSEAAIKAAPPSSSGKTRLLSLLQLKHPQAN